MAGKKKQKIIVSAAITVELEDPNKPISKKETKEALRNAAYAFIHGQVSQITVRSIDED